MKGVGQERNHKHGSHVASHDDVSCPVLISVRKPETIVEI